MKRSASIFLALAAWAGVAIGGPYEDATAAYKRQDYATAFAIIKPLADQGNAAAQNNLGLLYAKGEGVPKDDQQAALWFRKAADQGHAFAQDNLGGMYANGRGVPKDDQQAVLWFRKAADQGNAAAQNNMGLMYASGRGVPKDDQQAALWFRKAADQGVGAAQNNLGFLYVKGEGVPKDDQQAAFWFRKGADQGHADAQNNMGYIYRNGQGVPKNDQQAYFWWLLASAAGNADATRNRDIQEKTLPASQRIAAQEAARDWKPGSSAATSSPSPPSRSSQADATGSAFRVGADHLVTNRHVVADCARIRVDGQLAGQVAAQDERNDLALIKSAGSTGPAASIRAGRTLLGEVVTVAGFPLQGLLTGLSTTNGNVSRMSGLGGDTRMIQISAPVQPGNSGGPLIDASGAVIGVVVSKLDALKVAKVTGDIPQNVNFALNSNVLRSFLDANNVDYRDATTGPSLSPAEIANRAKAFTVLVECWK